ncbi:aminoglycoside 6'-N-acetyltransferase [Microvirga lotononidis]|uniref:Aminoglycoside N(6')-acetyltransferase type 1 n=1 Tax=Microvirga lotononidis TaxID=864069 RepID=I4YQ68_9HYPH|nr:aminoglycoside 6'-N-acetyltransferase [Microvirga lotononidis]EIM26110.1 acetyltransferase [Microvirga lotononidis]WQO26014.1 aminoglycoside 6'-N-acetyltransferase [Microvirga lotononidis]
MNDGSLPKIEPCTLQSLEEWAKLRHALWPDGPVQEHRSEAQAMLWEQKKAVAFLVRLADGTAAGFAEAALRHDYVNGCATSPVAFLEGIYVEPEHRHRGLARVLCRAVEDWARRLGCREFASDVLIENIASQDMHRALGFEETERVVYYRKPLSPG